MRVQMLIRLPDNLKQSLQQAAKSKDYSLNRFVIQILWEWVKRNA